MTSPFLPGSGNISTTQIFHNAGYKKLTLGGPFVETISTTSQLVGLNYYDSNTYVKRSVPSSNISTSMFYSKCFRNSLISPNGIQSTVQFASYVNNIFGLELAISTTTFESRRINTVEINYASYNYYTFGGTNINVIYNNVLNVYRDGNINILTSNFGGFSLARNCNFVFPETGNTSTSSISIHAYISGSENNNNHFAQVSTILTINLNNASLTTQYLNTNSY